MSEADYKELKKGGMMRQAEAGLFSGGRNLRPGGHEGRLSNFIRRDLENLLERFGNLPIGEIHIQDGHKVLRGFT